MKSDLRNLVTAEEAFFADSVDLRHVHRHGQLKFKPSLRQHAGDHIGPGYWTATVTHSQIPDFTCGIAVNTANPVVTTAAEGEPACQ